MIDSGSVGGSARKPADSAHASPATVTAQQNVAPPKAPRSKRVLIHQSFCQSSYPNNIPSSRSKCSFQPPDLPDASLISLRAGPLLALRGVVDGPGPQHVSYRVLKRLVYYLFMQDAIGNPPVECLLAVEPFFTGINVREPRQLLAVLQKQRKLPVRMHEVRRLDGAGQPKEPYLDLRLVVELPGVEGVECGDDRRDLVVIEIVEVLEVGIVRGSQA